MASRRRFLTFYLFAMLMAGSALAQSTSSNASSVEPEARAALDRMGAYLRTLHAFQVQADTNLEEVLIDGQKVQWRGTANILVRRPDGLRVEVNGDKQHRFFFFDGRVFTLWAPRVDVYASVAAPPTLAKFVDVLSKEYDIELPLTDLFLWGSDQSQPPPLTDGFDVGPSQVQGTSCEHYAFRQAGVDWEVWIQLGDYPLPRRLVITSADDEARPSYASDMTWNLAPSFDPSAFTFVPGAGAQKITFAQAAVAGRNN
jgi:hypothetical protein